MNALIQLVGTAALLGSALVGGVFFAFSSFVMKALARRPSPEGIAAMQSINVVVINPSFLGLFLGTALVSLAVAALMLLQGHSASNLFLGGAISYFVGTFLVTMMMNVPLNDRLAAVLATDAAATDLWRHYLHRWTLWNHVRTIAAMLAAILYSLGLVQSGGA